jgi:hypothetical protein
MDTLSIVVLVALGALLLWSVVQCVRGGAGLP